jgi:hypothetical protein
MQNDATFPASSDLTTTVKMRINRDIVELVRSQEWWDAQQRMLFYLQALKVPAEASLRIALEALRRAMADSRRIKNSSPTSLAMRALRQILAEEDLDCLTRIICSFGDFHKPGSINALSSSSRKCIDTLDYGETVLVTKGNLPVMPPLNRSSMRAEPMERSLMDSLVLKLLDKFKKKHHRSVDSVNILRRRR